MSKKINRAYSAKDVDMLTACGSIIEHAINHKDVLIAKRPNWNDPFFPNLKARIDAAFSDYLSIDSAQELREATQTVLDIQAKALFYLAEFKVQVEEDFKNRPLRRDEILNRLGFKTYYQNARKGDQEALVQLLVRFKKNMNHSLQVEVGNAGIAKDTLAAILSFADALKEANIAQENLKANRKVISASTVKELNDIYQAVISIARIAAKFFKGNTAVQQKFSFAKTLKALNSTTPNGNEEQSPPAITS